MLCAFHHLFLTIDSCLFLANIYLFAKIVCQKIRGPMYRYNGYTGYSHSTYIFFTVISIAYWVDPAYTAGVSVPFNFMHSPFRISAIKLAVCFTIRSYNGVYLHEMQKRKSRSLWIECQLIYYLFILILLGCLACLWQWKSNMSMKNRPCNQNTKRLHVGRVYNASWQITNRARKNCAHASHNGWSNFKVKWSDDDNHEDISPE